MGAPGLGTENGEEIENPPNTHSPQGSARPTHLHAGVESPVHLGLDIHHLSNTGKEKQEVSLPEGMEGGSRGPRYLWASAEGNWQENVRAYRVQPESTVSPEASQQTGNIVLTPLLQQGQLRVREVA